MWIARVSLFKAELDFPGHLLIKAEESTQASAKELLIERNVDATHGQITKPGDGTELTYIHLHQMTQSLVHCEQDQPFGV